MGPQVHLAFFFESPPFTAASSPTQHARQVQNAIPVAQHASRARPWSTPAPWSVVVPVVEADLQSFVLVHPMPANNFASPLKGAMTLGLVSWASSGTGCCSSCCSSCCSTRSGAGGCTGACSGADRLRRARPRPQQPRPQPMQAPAHRCVADQKRRVGVYARYARGSWAVRTACPASRESCTSVAHISGRSSLTWLW